MEHQASGPPAGDPRIGARRARLGLNHGPCYAKGFAKAQCIPMDMGKLGTVQLAGSLG